MLQKIFCVIKQFEDVVKSLNLFSPNFHVQEKYFYHSFFSFFFSFSFQVSPLIDTQHVLISVAVVGGFLIKLVSWGAVESRVKHFWEIRRCCQPNCILLNCLNIAQTNDATCSRPH